MLDDLLTTLFLLFSGKQKAEKNGFNILSLPYIRLSLVRCSFSFRSERMNSNWPCTIFVRVLKMFLVFSRLKTYLFHPTRFRFPVVHWLCELAPHSTFFLFQNLH